MDTCHLIFSKAAQWKRQWVVQRMFSAERSKPPFEDKN